MRKTKLRIKPATAKIGGLTYKSYRVVGTVNGRRIRFQFTDRSEAFAVLTRLQIEDANCATVQARPHDCQPNRWPEADKAFLAFKEGTAALVIRTTSEFSAGSPKRS